MSVSFTESTVEDAALEWLAELGYRVVGGAEIAPGEPDAEREGYGETVLARRFRLALQRLNPMLPREALEDAARKVLYIDAPTLVSRNHRFHGMLRDGVGVEYQREDGSIAGAQARLIDFDDPDANDWLAVNQFTVVEGQSTRRPDVLAFINGLPLAIMELKDASNEGATIWSAFNDHQTKKQDIPSLFAYSEALIISDGLEARVGSLTANREWFMPWRTIEGEELASPGLSQLEVLISGLFSKQRFLDFLHHFIVFEDDGKSLVKKLAGYHQFHAVNKAIETTVKATSPEGDQRAGVVWHTQGSGKSLTMAFYAGKIVQHPVMANPTLVVITDRNDLDDQLFGTFSRCSELMRQRPVQAESREHLIELLKVASGGVVFTTIQKFFPDEGSNTFPLLSDRKNIVVIADEAHRSQYGFAARLDPRTGEIVYGMAKYMRDALPNASFIGFTGTPIELTDRNTKEVFGDYISIYDIQRAVQDGATVPIYYESRLAKIELAPAERPTLDAEFEEVTEGEEVERKEKLKSKWAALEALVGAEKRIDLITRDLVEHFEERLEAMDGKAMIVCMSRRICVDLYNAIVGLRPQWHDDDDANGEIKVVMTGSASDALEWQPHVRNKAKREALASRFKDATDPLKVVIVRDMWLTGFDAPSLHTMYVDKPMRGHGLMQAIARVNRVFRDKPGGLVVDYLGLADELRQAMVDYTQSGGVGRTAIDKAEAIALMQAKYEVCCGLFHGFDWSKWTQGTAAQRLSLLPAAQEHILGLEDGKKRLMQAVAELSSAFALSASSDEAIAIREDIAFFQAVRAALAKSSALRDRRPEELDQAIRQIISKAIISDEVIDIFSAAGLQRPDISVLSDEFLAEVRNLPQRNLAVELLQKLLNDDIKTRLKTNAVQQRLFSEMLERSIRAYQNRAVETAQVIEELIQLAKDMKAAQKRGEDLGLNEAELAFYDALAANESAVEVLGDETLRDIARELVVTVRRNVTVDWTIRENVRAKLRVLVRTVLRNHGYPPDKQEQATKTVLEQAELLGAEWAA